MDDAKKSAYRYVIYWAMLRIRGLRWLGYRRTQAANPFYWWKQRRQILASGEIAEWLHNAAAFSAYDFVGFSEERFWKEHDRLIAECPEEAALNFRQVFENRLHECRTGKWPAIEEQIQRRTADPQPPKI